MKTAIVIGLILASLFCLIELPGTSGTIDSPQTQDAQCRNIRNEDECYANCGCGYCHFDNSTEHKTACFGVSAVAKHCENYTLSETQWECTEKRIEMSVIAIMVVAGVMALFALMIYSKLSKIRKAHSAYNYNNIDPEDGRSTETETIENEGESEAMEKIQDGL